METQYLVCKGVFSGDKLTFYGFIMIKTIFVLSFCLSSLTFAQETIHGQIKSLANNIYVSVDSTDLSLEELEKIKDSLVKINALLSGESPFPGGSIDPTEPSFEYDVQLCKKLAKSAYEQSFSSATAREKAVEVCSTYKDLELLKFFYKAYSQGYSSAKAMDMAARQSGIHAAGKFKLAKSIYPVYSLSLGPIGSADKTGLALPKLEIDATACLKDAYSDYSLTYAPGIAMDKSVEECKSLEE